MKSRKIIYSLIFCTSSIFAGETSIPTIEVKSIDPGEWPLNSRIELKGGDINTLFNSLPYTTNSDDDSNDEAKNFRSIAIYSPAYLIDLNCKKIDNDGNPLAETSCTFGVYTNELEGDLLKHDPSEFPQLPKVISVKGIDPGRADMNSVVKASGKEIHLLNRMLKGASSSWESPGYRLKLTCDGKDENEFCTFKLSRRS